MLSSSLIRGLLLQINRDPIIMNNGSLHQKVLEVHQRNDDKGKDTQNDPIFITGARVAVEQEDGGP